MYAFKSPHGHTSTRAVALSVTINLPVHCGVVFGAGQTASSVAALQAIGVAPLSSKPALQLNVATLPWLLLFVLTTVPFAGALA